MERWEEVATEIIVAQRIIDKGLKKLDDYREKLTEVPAYVLAMGKHICFMLDIEIDMSTAIEPGSKLGFFREISLEKFEWARRMLIGTVSVIKSNSWSMLKLFIRFTPMIQGSRQLNQYSLSLCQK